MSFASESIASKPAIARSALGSLWPHVVVVVVAALLASGTLMRVGSFTPNNVLGTENNTRLLWVHATLVLSTAFIALVYFAPSRRASHSLRGMVAVAHVVSVSAMTAFANGSRAAVLLGCGVCVVVTGLFALLVLDPRSWAGALFLVASLAQASAWVGTMVGSSKLFGATLYPLVLATVVAPLLPPRSSSRPLLLSAVLTYLLARTAVHFLGLGPLALVELVAGIGVACAVMGSASREPTAGLRWGRRIEGALFAEAVVLSSFIGIVGGEVHLSDTLFPLGATHFEALVLVFAFLRALVPAKDTRWASSGLLLGAVGAQVFCWGTVVLGSRGMPRRYAQYLEMFTVLQTVTSVGALVLCAGVLFLGAAYLASRASRATER